MHVPISRGHVLRDTHGLLMAALNYLRGRLRAGEITNSVETRRLSDDVHNGFNQRPAQATFL